MNSIELSLIVPVHNLHGRYQNLNTWIRQPLPSNLEIIFVIDEQNDSAKTEFTTEVLNEVPRKFVVVADDFRGPGTARNKGISLATGKYLAFIDSDDIPDITEYFALIKKMEVSDADLGIGSFVSVDFKTGILQPYMFAEDDTKQSLKLLSRNPGLWRMIFKRIKIEQHEFPALRMGEDQVFIVRALQSVEKIEFTSNFLYKYFVNQDNQLTNDKSSMDDITFSIEIMGQMLNQNDLKWRGLIEEMYLKLFVSRLVRGRNTFSKRGASATAGLIKALNFTALIRLLPACFRIVL